jgi:multiple sugar transport system substrate-binding protein
VFTSGDAVFLRNWSYVWVIAQNPAQSKVAGKVGVAPLPAFPGGHSTATMGGYQFMVARSSPHLAAATTFAQFLSSEPSQLFFAKTVAFSPTRPAVLSNAQLRAKDPFLIKLRKVFLGVTARPVTPLYPQISLAIQADLSSALSGRMSTSSALSDIQNRMQVICGHGTCAK